MLINKIFVYGTLKQGFCNYPKIHPFCKNIRSAVLQGILYDLPFGYPGAIDGKGKIRGQVFELNDVELALQILDELEDYFGPGCADNVYERVIREVGLTDGSFEYVYVYLWRNAQLLAHYGRINNEGEWT